MSSVDWAFWTFVADVVGFSAIVAIEIYWMRLELQQLRRERQMRH